MNFKFLLAIFLFSSYIHRISEAKKPVFFLYSVLIEFHYFFSCEQTGDQHEKAWLRKMKICDKIFDDLEMEPFIDVDSSGKVDSIVGSGIFRDKFLAEGCSRIPKVLRILRKRGLDFRAEDNPEVGKTFETTTHGSAHGKDIFLLYAKSRDSRK